MANRSRHAAAAGAFAPLGALTACGSDTVTTGASPRPAGTSGGPAAGTVSSRVTASPGDAAPAATGRPERAGTRCVTPRSWVPPSAAWTLGRDSAASPSC